MEESKDRRASVRIPVATVAHITPNGLQETAKVVVRDLLANGMGCTSDRHFHKGDMLFIKIKLTKPDNEVFVESLTGRVAWSKDVNKEKQGSLGNDHKYEFGIEFRQVERLNPRLFTYVKDLENISNAT